MNLLRHNRNAGFSLVELLFAVALAGIVGTAVVSVFVSATRTTTAQTNLSDSQQNLRASIDRLAQHVRVAGFGLPERSTFSLTFGGNTFTRPVTVTNGDPNIFEPDSLTVVGIGRDAGRLNAYQTDDCNEAGKNCLSLVSNADFKDDNGNFNPLRRYISLDGAAFLEVTGVVGDNIITLDESLASLPKEFFDVTPYPSVFILQALTYSIATDLTGCSVEQPCLAVRDFTNGSGRQVLAQGIEDMQIGIFETPPGGGGAEFSSGETTSSARISALRINLVGKSRTPDREAIFPRPLREDQIEITPPNPDSFRRRVLTTVVKIRNPRPDS